MDSTYNFDMMAERLKDKHVTVAVAQPKDDHTVEVVTRCLTERLADFILVADEECRETAERICKHSEGHAEVVMAADAKESASIAVKAVKNGRADVLMKGTVNTDVLLRAVLDKENGLLKPGQVMSHVAAAHIPEYGKMILFSDAAVIPRPDIDQFDAILTYTTDIFHRMNGVETTAHVALIHCTEKVSEKFPHTIAYQELKRRADDGRYGLTIMDGPMDVKTACDAESAHIKGINSNVAGKADILIFPNIEAGNTFYKTITYFAHASTAGLLCGVTSPVVVASRADTAESKYHSLIMACSLA